MTVGKYEPNLDGSGVRIGVVQARFNADVCHGLVSACLAELKHLGVEDGDVLHVTVPGALEIPLALQKMAETEQFDALIAIGAVIRGETYHFELVSNESGAGITRVGLDFGIPVANAVLTTDTDEQAEARMVEKGTDAARVAVEMANLSYALETLAAEDEAGDDEDEVLVDDLEANERR
ncbi:MAG: 6,7-dimethyl-8-ribityllumazine synthase [Paucimonas sp.]|jgi:6,7-dimethyl-8-ribityllumazine synthase|nr:6,7-dimethyl-8-ribityllumazine synthase [Paucimonas sp.]